MIYTQKILEPLSNAELDTVVIDIVYDAYPYEMPKFKPSTSWRCAGAVIGTLVEMGFVVQIGHRGVAVGGINDTRWVVELQEYARALCIAAILAVQG